jgi:hypothetical protein
MKFKIIVYMGPVKNLKSQTRQKLHHEILMIVNYGNPKTYKALFKIELRILGIFDEL